MLIFFRRGRGGFVFFARMFGAFVARQRADHQIDGFAHEFGCEIGMTVGRDFVNEFVDDREADVSMRHFAMTAKTQDDFDFHVFAQEINGVRDFDAEVVRVNERRQLDFLHSRSVLMLARFFFFLGLFVAEFAEVHEAADGRNGVRRNLDKVNAVLAREREGVVELQNANLCAVVANDADFAGADFAVDPDERGGGGIALWRKRAAQATLTGWN